MIVILTEKPSVARAIAISINANTARDGFFENEKYQVTWAFGHLVHLESPEDAAGGSISLENLPIIPDEIKSKVSEQPHIKKQYKTIKKLFDNCSSIICATDAGREGELIFRAIYYQMKCKKPFKRLWISSINSNIIKEGLENLRDSEAYDNLYSSSKLRRDSDWLLGFNASICSSRINGFTIKLGRVKTPTLFLVVKRYLENQKFKPEKFYQPKIEISNNTSLVLAQFDERIFNEDELYKILSILENQKQAELTEIIKEEKKQKAPNLFNLGDLQKTCNRSLGYTADDTLDVLQKLYEKGYVTYPRTDSNYLNEEMEYEVWELIQELGNAFSLNEITDVILNIQERKPFNNKKVTDHHAIIPTKQIPKIDELEEKEKNIYIMILAQLLKAFSEELKKDSTIYVFNVQSINPKFKAIGSVITQKGWKIVDEFTNRFFKKDKSQEDNENENNEFLPVFEKGIYPISNIINKESFTKAPALLNDASLISQMENCGREIEEEELREALKDAGIGTAATRAEIIKELIKERYIERKSKSLIPTELGYNIVKSLNGQKILSPKLTGEWELKLKLIEQGKLKAETFEKEIKEYAQTVVNEIKERSIKIPNPKKLNIKCPKCEGAELLQNKYYYYCEDNTCGYKLNKTLMNHKITEKELETLLNGKEIKNVNFKSKADKAFTANMLFNKNLEYEVKFNKQNKRK